MKKYVTGLNTVTIYFDLDEYDKYQEILNKFKGFTTTLFINNGYGVEIRKRTINL